MSTIDQDSKALLTNMGTFNVIRPCDDAAAKQCSSWADELIPKLTKSGHSLATDLHGGAAPTPTHTADVIAAFKSAADLLCYFGHGDEDNWLTNSGSTIGASSVCAAGCKAVVSVACKAGCNLGPACVTAGVASWLGFTIKVTMPVPHLGTDPIGDAIVNGLELLGFGRTMREVADKIEDEMDDVVQKYDTGGVYSTHPLNALGYCAAMCLRDHVVVHGSQAHVSL